MNRQIFITLPVADLAKSRAFFEALGFSHNPQFTGEGAACIIISETIFVMLATHSKFCEFSPKPICDPATTEVLHAITCESRAQVDDLVAKAGKNGGTIHEQSVDYGFMYHGSFVDPDGHLWALNYMSDTPPQN
jgi:hypothetical protein